MGGKRVTAEQKANMVRLYLSGKTAVQAAESEGVASGLVCIRAVHLAGYPIRKPSGRPVRDLSGRRFGKLIVIRRVEPARKHNKSNAHWLCRCDCGEERVVHSGKLLASYNPTRHCGCSPIQPTDPLFRGHQTGNHIGKRFGRLVAITYVPGRKGERGSSYRCQCDCGKQATVITGNLVGSRTVSCGCRHAEVTAVGAHQTHGGSKSRLYNVWNSMCVRCRNPNSTAYENYGARGIKVCSRWADSFAAFREDMGDRPSKSHSLDRIDNDGHYSCGKCEECLREGWVANCRWATLKEQARNKRTSLKLTHDGKTQTLKEWAEETGLPYLLLWTRIAVNKLSVSDALTLPHRKHTGVTAKYKLSMTRCGMIHRCTDPSNISYKNYGGRGITICARWLASLANFRADMGEPPTQAHSIDRIDNDKGYWCGKPECPECGSLKREPNCRWTDRATQAKNKRRNGPLPRKRTSPPPSAP